MSSRTLLPAALIAASLVACNHQNTPNTDPPSDVRPELARFASCSAFKDGVTDSWVETLISWRYGYGWLAEDAEGDADDGGSDGPSDFSTTNVQEEGVDEPDLVKTDGKYLYVLDQWWDGSLYVVKSWPAAETEVVATLDLGGQPYSMFLDGDRLAVFSYVWNDGTGTGDMLRNGYGTRVTFVDVSDRATPTIERQIDVEGWLTNARLIGHDAYLVFNHWMDMPVEVQNLAWDASLGLPEPKWDGTDAEQEAIREAARAILRPHVDSIVDGLSEADLLPAAYDHAEGEVVDGDPLFTCTDVYHGEGTPQPGMLSVAHVSLAEDEGAISATALFANGWTVYASQDNLYVAQTSWWWWWGWGGGDDALKTNIHRFALAGEDTVYEASGQVDGWLWNPYAMSEYGGYLRVASTSFDWWWGTAEDTDAGSIVSVLDQDLDVVGQVDGIAPGEQITSTRFLGEEGYLVTYEQVDPLFALDLSDPQNPKVVGELEIPGFSSYMHPLDDGYLVTVGMDGTDDGDVLGLAISVFDVTDPSAPALVDRLAVESDDWSWSEAMWDPHAFTFHNGVVTIPMYTYDWDEITGDWDGFSGLWVVAADTEGLTDLGRVDHEDLVADSECLYARYGYACTGDEGYWWSQVRRGVIMEDKLYSISDYGVKVNELMTPEDEVAEALFHPR